MNRTYLTPTLTMFGITCEAGFTLSDPMNDSGYGTYDVTIGYGGYDNEFE